MSDAITQGHEAAAEDRRIRDFLYTLPTHLFAPEVYTLQTFPRRLLPDGVDPISVNSRQDEVPTTEIHSFMEALRNKESHTWGKFMAHLADRVQPDWEAFHFLRSHSPFATAFITTVFRCTGGSLKVGHWDIDEWFDWNTVHKLPVNEFPASIRLNVNFD